MTFSLSLMAFVCAVASCVLGAQLLCAADALQERRYPSWIEFVAGVPGALLLIAGGPASVFFFALMCGYVLGMK